ncbi:MAG: PDGLE domain-containing protein [Candidatus Omnitrophica bacterium]|nr:PDGLE domain-containing protein [Candidatus Omnitrophota bacterium]MCM8824008.1 PDGLE domain-containing protein [Candidatus Omnitrophota bacterium]MCM8827307.1 PDGLE domain-containing protein [Candidatus Omnitrophota bacterium]
MRTITKLWIGIIFLVLISPLGLIIPQYFKAGDAWGEWGVETLEELVGYVPKGLERLADIWSAPLPDYAFKGWEDKPLGYLSLAYVFSGLFGIMVTSLVIIFITKLLHKNESK